MKDKNFSVSTVVARNGKIFVYCQMSVPSFYHSTVAQIISFFFLPMSGRASESTIARSRRFAKRVPALSWPPPGGKDQRAIDGVAIDTAGKFFFIGRGSTSPAF